MEEPISQSSNCQKWSKSTILTSKLEPIDNTEQFVLAMEHKNFEKLTDLNNVAINDKKRSKIQLLSCDNCNNTHDLTIEEINVTVNDKGETEEDETVILENLIINKQALEDIKNWSKSLN